MQDVKWGDSYDSGKPRGSGCWYCLVAGLRLYPHLEFETVAEMFHSKPEVSEEISAAIALIRDQEPSPFQPLSRVEAHRTQGHEVYFKLAFLTESELVKLLEVSPKSLKLPQATLSLQQEGCSISGYCLSLVGLPPAVRDSCHKVKIFGTTAISLADVILQPEMQVGQQQGERTFSHLGKVQASHNPAAFRPLQKASIPTLDDLLGKARKMIEAGVG